MNKLIYAYYVAGEKHAKQKRKANKEPYINHLLETVYQLSRAGVNDEDTLVSAVLHDSLEDTDLTSSDIKSHFGEKVYAYVRALTDNKEQSLEERRQQQVEHMRNAPEAVQVIKLADHISNIALIPGDWSKVKAKEYLAWSLLVAQECFSANKDLKIEYLKRFEAAKKKISGTAF